MMHHNKNKKFGRERKVRTGLMRSLAHNLILEGKMITTEAKAKAIRPYVERLVTHAKQDTVAGRRLVAARLGNDTMATAKLFNEIGPQYKERNGGYLRIVRVGVRAGDAAVRAYIGFV
jgi:large subunit ribosomal protein L17